MERFHNVLILYSFVIFLPLIRSASWNGDIVNQKILEHEYIPNQKEREIAFSPKARVKRQDTGSKYEEAAQMGLIKIVQLIVQMCRNLYAGKSVGGTTPWDEKVPLPVVQLFRDRIGPVLVKKKSKQEEEDEKEAG